LSVRSDTSSSPAIAPSPGLVQLDSNSEFSTQPGSPSDMAHPSSPAESWRTIDADIDADSVDPRCHPNAPEDNRACLNCKSTSTPLWRRSERGFFLCNACVCVESRASVASIPGATLNCSGQLDLSSHFVFRVCTCGHTASRARHASRGSFRKRRYRRRWRRRRRCRTSSAGTATAAQRRRPSGARTLTAAYFATLAACSSRYEGASMAVSLWLACFPHSNFSERWLLGNARAH
jgi:hypothetical protein